MSFPVDADALEDELPLLAPSTLARADDLCPRRLHEDYQCAPRTKEPFNSSRVRNAVIDGIRLLHESGGNVPEPGAAITVSAVLEPEERRVVEHALGWYPRLFDINERVTLETPLEEVTPLPRRGVRLSGIVDVCVVHEAGHRELRQLAFAQRGVPVDPLDLPAIQVAILRLAQVRWVEDEALTIVWSDLLTGAQSRASVAVPTDLAPMAAWLDTRLDVLTRRMDATRTDTGRDCTMCRYVPRCPAHALRGAMTTKKSDLVPGVISLSPTGLESWGRCRREWRNRALLRLPPSDPEGGTAHGLYLHQMLRFVHERGSCRDEGAVLEMLNAHDADDRVIEEVRRHVAKCPIGAESLGHEVEWVRANPMPPVFLASARLDAVWRHGDVLDVRDYKTGARSVEVLAEDPRARLQAWVAAPRATELGLRLRVRYEHLAREVDDDPDPWEPDDDDLAQIDEELRGIVAEMRAERDWRGVNDEVICRFCRYRSICPDSAAPSEPAWPAVVDAIDDEVVPET